MEWNHSQVTVTANVYSHVWEAQKEEAVNKLEASLTAHKKAR